MGLIHHPDGPPAEPDVAHALPALDDRGVSEALALSSAFAAVRQAVLALSGIALLQSLGRGSPESMAGVVVTARQAVETARDRLVAPTASRVEPLSRRAVMLEAACARLDDELDALVRNRRALVPRAALGDLRCTLAATSLVHAGMRQFTSTSCAAYVPGAELDGRHRDHKHTH